MPKAAWLAPVVVMQLMVVALIVALIVTFVTDVNIGGISFPYISDTCREGATYGP